MGQSATLVFILLLSFGNQVFAQGKGYSPYRKLTPTLYYIPVYNLDQNYQCDKGDNKKPVLGSNQKPLQPAIEMCRADRKNCTMQGSCAVVINKKRMMLHYFDLVQSQTNSQKMEPLFKLAELGECPYGRGPGNVCLEPFYTLAADPVFYKSGDVIYIPALKGLFLPNGDIHDGFMVVRDQGGQIKGQDRFDFFTGFFHHEAESNPFTSIKLADKNTQLQYAKVIDPVIKKKILARRAYPGLPAQ